MDLKPQAEGPEFRWAPARTVHYFRCMRLHHKLVLDQLKEIHQENRNILALLVIGSVARGTSNDDSGEYPFDLIDR